MVNAAIEVIDRDVGGKITRRLSMTLSLAIASSDQVLPETRRCPHLRAVRASSVVSSGAGGLGVHEGTRLLRHRDALDLQWVVVVDHARLQTSKWLRLIASNLGPANNHVMDLVRTVSQSQRAL